MVKEPDCRGSLSKAIRFLIKEERSNAMRSFIVNKILSFQYRLGKLIGRKEASRVCILLDRSFTTLFGREVYDDTK
jgi:hypothetical protein